MASDRSEDFLNSLMARLDRRMLSSDQDEKVKRIPKEALLGLEELLTDRDKAELQSMDICRYMTSGQIQRLHFTRHSSASSATRSTNRVLNKLKGYGLVTALKQRIGGDKAGSSEIIWLLTDAGARLVHLYDFDYIPHKRKIPGENYLKHILLVSEAYVRLHEITQKHQLTLKESVPEPLCWRSYKDKDGKYAQLKPDLYTVISDQKYDYYYFLEIDCDTETPKVVLEKCRRYRQYNLSGKAKEKIGVMPLVVWVVPSEKRKKSLEAHIANCKELPYKNYFRVILLNELETLVISNLVAPDQQEAS